MWPLFMTGDAGPVHVGPAVQRVQASRESVAARVAGRRIWFESADASLAAAAEVFGTALLVSAMPAGRSLARDRSRSSTSRRT